MISPRLEINLDKIYHNASTLVRQMSLLGISVTGITKAVLGSSQVANVMIRAGVASLGDSRIENIDAMRCAGINCPILLTRSPMLSQVDQVVRLVDISLNTEISVLRALSLAATKIGRIHGIVLMVEMGDLREGLMFDEVEEVLKETLGLPNIIFKGLGTNLACQNGVIPDDNNMTKLSVLADSLESKFGLQIDTVTGGNSANLSWISSGGKVGRIDNIRLGESILLGRDPLDRKPIEGLYTDAFEVVAEVIESKFKPSQPWGSIAQPAYGEVPKNAGPGPTSHTILAIGRQDIDPNGLTPTSKIEIIGGSGDHLVVNGKGYKFEIGSEIRFIPNYSSLLRAMTSPFVSKVMKEPSFKKSVLPFQQGNFRAAPFNH